MADRRNARDQVLAPAPPPRQPRQRLRGRAGRARSRAARVDADAPGRLHRVLQHPRLHPARAARSSPRSAQRPKGVGCKKGWRSSLDCVAVRTARTRGWTSERGMWTLPSFRFTKVLQRKLVLRALTEGKGVRPARLPAMYVRQSRAVDVGPLHRTPLPLARCRQHGVQTPACGSRLRVRVGLDRGRPIHQVPDAAGNARRRICSHARARRCPGGRSALVHRGKGHVRQGREGCRVTLCRVMIGCRLLASWSLRDRGASQL